LRKKVEEQTDELQQMHADLERAQREAEEMRQVSVGIFARVTSFLGQLADSPLTNRQRGLVAELRAGLDTFAPR
jgi:hypothetical protein